MLYWRSPSGVPVVLILIVVEVVMKLFKVAVPIIVVSLLQISCASSSKKSPKQNDDASRFTDVKALSILSSRLARMIIFLLESQT